MLGLWNDILEVMFSKTKGSRSELWRVYIELNADDIALLEAPLSDSMKTRVLVRRASVCELLPVRLNDKWPGTGRVIKDRIIGTWDGGVKPTIRAGKQNVWVIHLLSTEAILLRDLSEITLHRGGRQGFYRVRFSFI